MSETPEPTYQWATHTDPDVLVLQFTPVPVFTDGGSRDAMKTLFTTRGFVPVTQPVGEAADLGLRPANGCALTRLDASTAELLLTIGTQVGASRVPLGDLDPAWLERVVATGHAGVLVVDSAVQPDGTTTRDHLRRDVDAGGVLAALVPAADPVRDVGPGGRS